MPPRKKAAPKPRTIADEDAEQEEIFKEILEESGGIEEVEEEVEETIVEKAKKNPEPTEDPIKNIVEEAPKVMIFMRRGTSYSTPHYEWTKEHPFQLMDALAADTLLKDLPDRFSVATKIQVEEFYA